jgi:Leucine-rich repeat (LRR) protein
MKNILLSLTFSFLGITLIAQVSQKEQQALLDLYSATNGENWINTWDINEPVSNWHGITVDNNQVTAINLLFNNMEGRLPSSIGDLEHLKSLELSFNKISGEIPSEIGKLTQLEVFALNGNNIEGSIPSSIGSLSSLKELHLSSNNISGSIPNSLNALKQLEVLNLFDNSISGALPAQLSNSKNLKQVIIAKNEIIENDAFADKLFFRNEAKFKPNVAPLTKTVIATETSDDN